MSSVPCYKASADKACMRFIHIESVLVAFLNHIDGKMFVTRSTNPLFIDLFILLSFTTLDDDKRIWYLIFD